MEYSDYQTRTEHQLNFLLNLKLLPLLLVAGLLAGTACERKPIEGREAGDQKRKAYAIAIHGGAGTISKDMPDSTKKVYKAALDSALTIGKQILANGGSSLDAVEQTIRYLENNPLFNAGKGAVYTSKGEHELDAAIMNGETLEAGAITGVKTVKHPITLARHVMKNSRHILFAGDGAEAYADQTNVERVENSYFDTRHRYESWQESKEDEKPSSLHKYSTGRQSAIASAETGSPGSSAKISGTAVSSKVARKYIKDDVFGTVGCVALDKDGDLAAGTSTGGLTGKEFGRVGDVPIIGAGTYADGKVAVSATGIGEDIMRHVTGFHVSAYKQYAGTTLKKAAHFVIHKHLNPGEAGLISVDSLGNISMPYNTTGMYRGAADSEGKHVIKIWK